jgi:hypothetical protein
MLSVNPASEQVAVVETDGVRSFSIVVWDWEEERLLFRVPLRQEPLFIRYSGMGSMIVYGESAWESLHIVSARDGVPFPFHPEGFGIVGFAEVSRSEKTVMTYRIAGRISYWDLSTGALVRDVATVPRLAGIRLSRDRRYMAGLTGEEIVLVDTLTGATCSRAPFSGIGSFDFSPDSSELSGAAPASQGVLSRWSLAGGLMTSKAALPFPQEPPSILRYGKYALFFAGNDGEIRILPPAGQPQSFCRDELAEVSDFAVAGSAMALGSAEWIRIFSSDLLSSSRRPSFVRSTIVANPFHVPVGIGFLSETRLLVWRRDSTLGLAMLDIPSGSFRDLPTGFQAPLAALSIAPDNLLGIEKSGFVRLLDTATGSVRFESWNPGMLSIVPTSQTEIIGGGNPANASEGSLLRIDIRTGETVAIPGRSVFTYDLLFDPRTGSLFSVGVDASCATHLLRNDGRGFERETSLDSVPGEDLDVSLALDASTGILYSSLGERDVGVWDGRQLSRLKPNQSIVRKLLASDGILYSLNRDSTVSIRDGTTGESIAELSLFTEGEWSLLVSGGWYAASPGGDVRVRVFVGEKLVRSKEDYRLRIQEL